MLATDPFLVGELKRISGVKVIGSIHIPREIVPIKDMQAFSQLLKLLRRERYDVVHTYSATPAFLGRIAARLVGVPVILHHQAGGPVTEFSSVLQRILYTPLEYFAVLASSKSICVGHGVAAQQRQLHTTPRHKMVTICNGIEPQPFIAATQNGSREALRHELGIPCNHLIIGNTCRLVPQKDNVTLIQAMEMLRAMIKDVPFTLLIAGDGPDRQKLEKLVHSLDLSENVRFLGFWKDMPAFLAMLDIFASPSLWEGLSISLLEAMAAAKPIVTTTILPNAELIENEVTGLLVPPKSPEQIAKAITRFVLEPELSQRCSVAARQLLLANFTIDRMFQETLNLYTDLMRSKDTIYCKILAKR